MTYASTSSTPIKRLTVKEAQSILEEIRTSGLDPGQKWYLVSKNWWDSFLTEQEKWKFELLSEIALPPISNENLVQEPNTSYAKTDYKLKENLVEDLHYKLVPEKQFTLLKDRFGVENKNRDVISRPVVVGAVLQREPFVEVYPLKLKIAKFNRRDDVKVLEISYANTFDELKSKAFDLLNVAKENRETSRILVEKSENDFEAINDKITSSLDSILRMDMVFFVDDGSKSLRSSSRSMDELNGNARRWNNLYGSADDERQNYTAGLCGLQNLGNTCFMNSALQCLSNVPELTAYFLSDEAMNEVNNSNVLGTGGRLAKAYRDLIKNLWSGAHSSVKPYDFKCVIGQFAPRFNGYAQQDAQELMAFLLDGLHEDLNRIYNKPYIEEKESDGRPDCVVAKEAWEDYKKRNDSFIVDLMHGQLKSTVWCNVCGKISIKFDPFCFLSVPVPTRERPMRSIVVVVFNDKKWKKFNILHTNKTLVKQVVAAIKKEIQLNDPKERLIMVTILKQMRNILNEEDPMPPNSYSVYTQMQTIFAYVCESGSLVMIENVSPNSYQRFLTYPLIVNFKHAISRRNLMQHMLPMIQNRFWRDKPKEQAASSTSKETSLMLAATLKDIYIDHPKLSQIPMPVDDDEVIDIKDSVFPPTISFHWKATENFIPFNQYESNEHDGEINLQQMNKRTHTLEECIEAFTNREQLDENEAWYCPQCKAHQRAFKKLDVWKLPKILIVHLKRFQYTRGTRDKIETEIVIPVKNFSPNSELANHKQEPAVYDLIAISNHMGGLGSGHYTAKAFLKTNHRWCEFNDSCTIILPDLPDPLQSCEAYILVYRQRIVEPSTTRSSTRATRRSKLSETDSMDTSEFNA